jgi:hypothetical protein
MERRESVELKNIEHYLDDELKRDTKYVLDRSVPGQCGIREVPKTEEDRFTIREKLETVRQRIFELESQLPSTLTPVE